MTGTKVTADWAWIGKQPGGTGSSMLDTSGLADLGKFVAWYAVGTPNSEGSPDAPQAPPWVTFAPFADGELASVSVWDPRREHDHTHRLVWPRRFFLFRFADLAAASASFRTVWQAVETRTLPPAGQARPNPAAGEPTARDRELVLTIDPQTPGDLTKVIGEHAPEWMAGLAAMVLEGPVAIAGATHLRREQRLGLLDAAAALLPYGFRAGLSASSSVDNTIRHGIRLVFADFANDQGLVSLTAPPPEPRTRIGRSYLAMLRRKLDAPGLAAVVSHLWADKHPRSFARPDEALTVLEELDRAGALQRALAERTATREEVLGFLCRPAAAAGASRPPGRGRPPSADDMPDELRERALSVVLARLDTDAASAVVTHWRAVAGDVQRLIAGRLDDGDVSLAAWCLREVSPALSSDAEDQLLAHLLVPERVAPQRMRQHRSALVELLCQREVPARGSFPVACAVLRYGGRDDWQALLVRELLDREITASDGLSRAVAWADWLCLSPSVARHGSPDWVKVLGYALAGHDDERPPEGFWALLLDDVWAATMLSLARVSGRLRQVLVPAGSALLDLAVRGTPVPTTGPDRFTEEYGQPARGEQGALLRALDVNLWQQQMPPEAVAVIDVVRLLLGGTPSDLPGAGPPEILERYGFGLADVLRYETVGPWQGRLQTMILAQLLPGGPLSPAALWLLNTWSADSDLERGLVNYLAGLPAGALPYSEGLSQSYWEAVARVPRLAGYASVPWIMSATREAVLNPATAQRAPGKTGLTTAKLAIACHTARQAGLSVHGILIAIAEASRSLAGGGGQEIRPAALYAVLRELQTLSFHDQESARDPGTRAAPEQDFLEFCRQIVQGALGRDYGRRFGRCLDVRIRQQVGEAQRTAARGRARRGQPRRRRIAPPSHSGEDGHAPRS
jgi:hypothetical protein